MAYVAPIVAIRTFSPRVVVFFFFFFLEWWGGGGASCSG